MWALLYVTLVVTPFTHTEREGPIYLLERFATVDGCLLERDRVGYAMADTYPYERDFIIVCRLIEPRAST